MAEKIAAAENILLLIHGIIGDTQNIAEGVGTAITEGGSPLIKSFDLVLTFDYESLGRSIEDTSGVLRASLASAGLGAHDGKRLTVLAHSMGGLVSRHFIEQGGGSAVVDHLVMCGTPNGGSPFGRVGQARKLLQILTGLAVNMPPLATLAPALAFALNRSKRLTRTLEQMDAGSPFLTELNGGDDPGISYTVLAGNVQHYRGEHGGLSSKLLTKLGGGIALEAMHGTESHDIAVALESIRHVADQRAHPTVKIDVACHHLNYFSSEAGLDALTRVGW